MEISIKEISQLTNKQTPENKDYGRCCVQFIGRLVFIANMEIKNGFIFLTNVKNVRYWSERENGLGELMANGFKTDDKIDDWPDTQAPFHQLLTFTQVNIDG